MTPTSARFPMSEGWPRWVSTFVDELGPTPAGTAARALLPFAMIDDVANPKALLEAIPSLAEAWSARNRRARAKTAISYASRLRVAVRELVDGGSS